MNYQELINTGIRSESGQYYASHIDELIEKQPSVDTYYDLLMYMYLVSDRATDKLLFAVENKEIVIFCPDNYFEKFNIRFSRFSRFSIQKSDSDIHESDRLKKLLKLFENARITHEIILYLVMTNNIDYVIELYNNGRIIDLSINVLQKLYPSCPVYLYNTIFTNGEVFIDKILQNEIEIVDKEFYSFIDIIPFEIIDRLYQKYYDGSINRVNIYDVNNIIESITLSKKYNMILYMSQMQIIHYVMNRRDFTPEKLDFIKANAEIIEDSDDKMKFIMLMIDENGSYSHLAKELADEYGIKVYVKCCKNVTYKTIDMAIELCIANNYIFDYTKLLDNYDNTIILVDIARKYNYHIDIYFSHSLIKKLHDTDREKIDNIISIYHEYSVKISLTDIEKLLLKIKFYVVDKIIDMGFINRSDIYMRCIDLNNYLCEHIDYFINTQTKIDFCKYRFGYGTFYEFEFIKYVLLKSIEYPEIVIYNYTAYLVDSCLCLSHFLKPFYFFTQEYGIEFKFSIDLNIIGADVVCNNLVFIENIIFLGELFPDKIDKNKLQKLYELQNKLVIWSKN